MSCLQAMEQKLWQIREHQVLNRVKYYSKTIVTDQIKSTFVHHSIPAEVQSDIRPQISVDYFWQFAQSRAPLIPLQPQSSLKAMVRLTEQWQKNSILLYLLSHRALTQAGWAYQKRERGKEEQRKRFNSRKRACNLAMFWSQTWKRSKPYQPGSIHCDLTFNPPWRPCGATTVILSPGCQAISAAL